MQRKTMENVLDGIMIPVWLTVEPNPTVQQKIGKKIMRVSQK